MPEFLKGPILIDAFHSIAVLGGLAAALYAHHRYLRATFSKGKQMRFKRQVRTLVAVLLAMLAAILLLPLGDMRGDLLQLYGLVVSATIALSSTTLVGNALAGIMLRTIRTCKPGDHITVGDHFGRIWDMDLLHTEIQNEMGGDLTTLPNLYLVTHPVRVMRESGTLLSVELSLGYDAPRAEVERLLKEAAVKTGLGSPFVDIRELGDYSVTYSVAGVLEDFSELLKTRRELRARVMDALHAGGVEIVSPAFMNTRAYPPGQTFIGKVPVGEDEALETSPDELIFDKAEQAKTIEELNGKLQEHEEQIAELNELAATADKDDVREAALKEREALAKKIEMLRALIESKSAKMTDER